MDLKRVFILFFILILNLVSLSLFADIEDGNIYMREGKYAEAIAEFKEVIEAIESEYDVSNDEEIKEALLRVYHWLADAYTKNNEPQRAEEIYERILEISPLDVKAQSRLDKLEKERKIESQFIEKRSSHFLLQFEDTGRIEREASVILDILEAAYKKVGADLGYYPAIRTTCIIYSSREQYRYVTGDHYWSSGQYDGKLRIPLSKQLSETEDFRRAVVHEYTHHVVALQTKNNCPIWLHEGLAQYEDGRFEDEELNRRRLQTLNAELEKNMLVPLKHLAPYWQSEKQPAASLVYYEAFSATNYLIKRYGLRGIRELLERLGAKVSIEKALQDVFQLDYQALDQNWQKFLAQGEPFIASRKGNPTATKPADTSEAKSLYSLAENYELNKKYKAALGEYKKIISEHPGTVWARKATERIKVIENSKR
jgi:tetratricopeptide (TPR) repeat protein